MSRARHETTGKPLITTEAAHRLLTAAVKIHNYNGDIDIGLLAALLQRCTELDTYRHEKKKLTTEILTARDHSSGYTPLHRALYTGDLCRVLLLLRTASDSSDRMTRRPMDLLYSNISQNQSLVHSLVSKMACALDHEGMTPAALLAARQRQELSACRASISYSRMSGSHNIEHAADSTLSTNRRRSRSNSVYDELSERHLDEQNEFGVLSLAMQESQRRRRRQASDDSSRAGTSQTSTDGEHISTTVSYGCEVFTFGRAHHCALGVVASSRRQLKSDGESTEQLRPQRVHAFAQDTVGRENSAVVVANASYHSLTVTAAGELYAFGLGKGGRLGTGDEKPCATPVRVAGPLLRQIVVFAAAAENHSLCVTSMGHVYAFGSNRFGQLGISSTTDTANVRCSPRRVDDLKNVTCASVAAGEKHSVALSRKGEVYVWGDNSAGQLGVCGRSSSINHMHKVQRVESLWKGSQGPKKSIAISAAAMSTLILATQERGLQVNSVYEFGHGNLVPSKVQFESSSKGRLVNPVAISCARFHNVAITSDGEVHCWGLHSDPLGTSRTSKQGTLPSDNSNPFTAPQVVSGMLPQNGGGRAVAVSASENHTAVLTEDGSLYMWGETYKQNILGYDGVRWQPVPKRVPGVHRAVSVAAAKEHTVLLIGTSFPPLLSSPSFSDDSSLASLAARKVAEHCDLFNVVPILIMAERLQSSLLLKYCHEFVKRNLDAVLNFAQRSALDCYLKEHLIGSSIRFPTDGCCRESRQHPFIADIVFAGSQTTLSFTHDVLCSTEEWLRACSECSMLRSVPSLMAKSLRHHALKSPSRETSQRTRTFSDLSVDQTNGPRNRRSSSYLDRCEPLISDIDTLSKEMSETNLTSFNKEARAIRKRLNQIAKLQKEANASEEQKIKIARRPRLESDLQQYEEAIWALENKLAEIKLTDARNSTPLQSGSVDGFDLDTQISEEACPSKSDKATDFLQQPVDTLPVKLRCEVCQIVCTDCKSYELHMNGRKHRNRSAQLLEEHKKKVATDMLEQQQKALLFARPSPPPKNKASSPWDRKTQGLVKLQFALSPPPHAVSDYVASPVSTNRLQDIMAEESKQKAGATRESHRTKTHTQPSMLLAPSVTSPWSTGKVVKVESSALFKIPTSVGLTAARSPPWTHSKKLNVPVSHPSPACLSPSKASCSLNDFFPAVTEKVCETTPTRWKTPQGNESAVSFRDIQDQEVDFQAKKDQSFGPNGKWFIERRERAGSLKQIQSESAKEKEERLLMEEQLRIERQIYEEIANRKNEEKIRNKKRTEDRKKGDRNGNKGLKKTFAVNASVENFSSSRSGISTSRHRKKRGGAKVVLKNKSSGDISSSSK